MKFDEAIVIANYLEWQSKRLRNVYKLNPLACQLEFLAVRLIEDSDKMDCQYMRDVLGDIINPMQPWEVGSPGEALDNARQYMIHLIEISGEQ